MVNHDFGVARDGRVGAVVKPLSLKLLYVRSEPDAQKVW